MKLLWQLNLFFLLLLTALGIYQVGKLQTRYSIEQFYPAGHELVKNHEIIVKEFRLNEDSPFLFVIRMKEGSWERKENIRALKLLSDELQARDDVKNLLSLTNIEGASSSQEELIIGNLFDRSPASEWKNEILNNPLLYPLLVTRDFSSTMIAVEAKTNQDTGLKVFEGTIKELIQDKFPRAEIISAGVPVMQYKFSDLIQHELVTFLGYLGLAFGFVFYFLFSKLSVVFAVFMVLGITNLFALGAMSLFGIPMNAILVTLPVILSVSMMSLMIHTLHLWEKNCHNEGDLRLKAYYTLKDLFLPNLLGILTTAFGFLALAPSKIPLISQYGMTVFGILLAVTILGQMVLFISLPYLRPKMRKIFLKSSGLVFIPLRYSKQIIFSMAFILLGGLSLFHYLNFSIKLFDDLPPGNKTREVNEWIDHSFGGIMSFDVKAKASMGYWKKPHNLNRLQSMLKDIRNRLNAGAVVSVPDFFQGEIPQKEDELAESLFMFTMAEKDPLKSFLSEDGSSLRIAFRLNDLPARKIDDIKKSILSTCQDYFPEVEFTFGGMAAYAHEINQEVAKELIYRFWEPLLLIGIFLIIIFRSFRWAFLACLPNFIPPAILIAALAISQVPVKPGIALIFSIALGFAFNNTLYLLTRLQKNNSLKKTLLQEWNPCLFESIVMFTGFTIFLTSEFNMNQIFGGFMLLSILAGLAADLFFLPAFLKEFPGLYKGTSYSKLMALTAVLSLASLPLLAKPLPEAKEILKKSQLLLDAKDDKARVEMKIIEQNGETKSRILNLQTLRKEGFSVLARIESPADIKNMAFLGNVDEEGNEKQWIYLPSSGKVRRLVTGKSKAGLLGSEISPEDLNSEAIKSSEVKMHKVDEKYYWIELVPEKGSSDYSKVITKISKDDYLPKYTAYYIHEKLKKTVAFRDYKKIGKIFRAHLLSVQNHLNGRATEVKLSSIEVNTGLSPDDFTQSNLKD